MTNTTLEKWEEKTLGEVCEIISGTTPDTSNDEFWGKGNYWITPAEINENSLYINSTARTITDKAVEYCSLRRMPRGTVLFSSRAPIGKIAISNVDSLYCNQGFKNFICSKNIHNKFLYYFLLKSRKYLISLGKGATFKEVSKSIISTVNIQYPPLPEQERIVAKLDKSFEAIDKVKANAEQNLNNAKELFESALNKVFTENTEGWEEKTLKEVCKKISAGGDKPENFSKAITENCEVPIYSNGIENDGLYGYTDVPAIKEEAITISARGTIGFICKRVKPYYPIVRLISAIPNDHINIDFMEYALKFMVPTGNGSSIPQLTVPMLKDKKVKYPSLPEQQKIVEKLDALQEQTKQLEAIYTQKIKECDELKQSILQKAFRGEL
ncbi:MAG: restriction endonuclease subunit S [Alphaproteobacteria bacterium]|nr:restriction endonuclease subunit S [Alphaproteobacteria bacterium]